MSSRKFYTRFCVRQRGRLRVEVGLMNIHVNKGRKRQWEHEVAIRTTHSEKA